MDAQTPGTGVGPLIVVDTDVFIDHFRGVQSASDYLQNIPGNQRATTDINMMELPLAGIGYYPRVLYGSVVANGQKTTLRKTNPDYDWLRITMSYNQC